jgi:hypothetical protein
VDEPDFFIFFVFFIVPCLGLCETSRYGLYAMRPRTNNQNRSGTSTLRQTSNARPPLQRRCQCQRQHGAFWYVALYFENNRKLMLCHSPSQNHRRRSIVVSSPTVPPILLNHQNLLLYGAGAAHRCLQWDGLARGTSQASQIF